MFKTIFYKTTYLLLIGCLIFPLVLTAKPKDVQTEEKDSKFIYYNFKVQKSLRPAVDFWKMVYTKYDRNFEIFHDTKNLNVVYSVLDFTDLYNNPLLDKNARMKILTPRLEEEKNRIEQILTKLAKGVNDPKNLSKEERYIYDLFEGDHNPRKFSEALGEKRIRAQTGIKDKFIQGIAASGAYIEEMEDIFTSYGLPVELTRLAFVESMFNLNARSKVGASGIWQFMHDTGRLYLTINQIVDERNDPILATHAAAQLLKHNYESLGTWPLAINAYNSGKGTMLKAVSTLGTRNIAKIIHSYNGGVYGFASRNFYPSFLAVLEITSNPKNYFGEITRDVPIPYQYHTLTEPQSLSQLSQTINVDPNLLAILNPHFAERFSSSLAPIPSGYRVRVPKH